MQGGALLAERDKDGLRDLPRLRISESAVEGGRYVHRERGRGIGHRLLKRSRQHLFEVFLIPRPALLQGFIDGDARACLPVTVHAVRQRLPVQRRALADHQRRLEQRMPASGRNATRWRMSHEWRPEWTRITFLPPICMVWPRMAGDPLAQGPIRAYSLVMAFRGPYSSRMYTPG